MLCCSRLSVKRISLYLLIALITFGLGVATWLTKPYKSTASQSPTITVATLDLPCAPDTFTVKQQPDVAMQLVIVEANCNGSDWNAKLTLQNLSPKAVRGYQVANSEDYDYKTGVRSSQGVMATGVVLDPAEIKTLDFRAGFQNGLSYGKPTGSIRRTIFWIEKVEYSDGTSWHEEPVR